MNHTHSNKLSKFDQFYIINRNNNMSQDNIREIYNKMKEEY